MAWTRSSQALNSPITLTRRALGAQTAKLTPLHAVDDAEVRPKLGVAVEEIAFAVEIDVKVGQEPIGEAIGVFQVVFAARRVDHDETIGEGRLAPWKNRFEEAGGVHLDHRGAFAGGHVQYCYAGIQRAKGANDERLLALDG